MKAGAKLAFERGVQPKCVFGRVMPFWGLGFVRTFSEIKDSLGSADAIRLHGAEAMRLPQREQ